MYKQITFCFNIRLFKFIVNIASHFVKQNTICSCIYKCPMNLIFSIDIDNCEFYEMNNFSHQHRLEGGSQATRKVWRDWVWRGIGSRSSQPNPKTCQVLTYLLIWATIYKNESMGQTSGPCKLPLHVLGLQHWQPTPLFHAPSFLLLSMPQKAKAHLPIVFFFNKLVTCYY